MMTIADNRMSLSVREYFAALAMQGLLPHHCGPHLDEDTCAVSRVEIAVEAVAMADALIAELNAPPAPD